MHHSGALLLEARDGFFLDEQLRPFAAPTNTSLPPLTNKDNTEAQPAMEDYEFDDFGGDAGYFGAEDDGGYPMEMDIPQQQQQSPAPWGGAQRALEGQAPLDSSEEDLFDPYAPLDPNDGSSMAAKPYKKMTRIPKQPRMRVQKDLPPQALTDGLLALAAPSAGVLFPEFTYALQHAQQEDAKNSRKNTRRGAIGGAVGYRTTNAQAQLNSVFTLEEAQAANAAVQEELDDAEDNNGFDPGFDDYDYGPGGDDGGVGFDEDFDDVAVAAAGAAVASQGGAWARNAPLVDALMGAGPSHDGNISYEDLCRAHVDSLIAAAAAAEVQTELASRVSTWRSKMAPMLEEEDTRPDFDIHVYGERILEGLASLTVSLPDEKTEIEEQTAIETSKESSPADGKDAAIPDAALTGPVQFEQVVVKAQTEQGYDVPRVFSSMLQLVNNGNLKIAKINDSSDDFTITLLSTELKHKRIGDYRAPSAIETTAAGGGEVSVLMDANREESGQAAAEVKKGKSVAVTGKAIKRRKA